MHLKVEKYQTYYKTKNNINNNNNEAKQERKKRITYDIFTNDLYNLYIYLYGCENNDYK